MLCFIHEIDYANFLFSVPKNLKCKSGKKSDLEIDVEDYAKIISEHCINNYKFKVEINLDFIRKIEKRNCRILFEYGEINWNLKSDKLIIKQKGRITKIYQSRISRNSLFKQQLSQFYKCINLKSKPISNLENGISSLKIVMAAKKSNKTKEKIMIN